MSRILFIVTFVAAIFGFIILIGGQAAANGAPQQAVIAVIGIGIAVIPYILARSVQLPADSKRAAQRHEELMAAIAELKQDERRSSM